MSRMRLCLQKLLWCQLTVCICLMHKYVYLLFAILIDVKYECLCIFWCIYVLFTQFFNNKRWKTGTEFRFLKPKTSAGFVQHPDIELQSAKSLNDGRYATVRYTLIWLNLFIFCISFLSLNKVWNLWYFSLNKLFQVQ